MATPKFQAEEHVENLQQAKQVAIGQIQALQRATGITLGRQERDSVMFESTFLTRTRSNIMDRVTLGFEKALEARASNGDVEAGRLAGLLKHDREARIGNKPTEIAPWEVPSAQANRNVTTGPRGITAVTEAQVQSIAAAYNVDPKYLLNELRTAHVNVSRKSDGGTSVVVQSSYINPNDPQQHMKSVANDLAANILFQAHGNGLPWAQHPNQADFSDKNLLAGTTQFALINTQYKLNNASLNLVQSEAKRLGVDKGVLGDTLMNYTALKQSGNTQLAEQYLGQSGINLPASEFVRIASSRITTAPQDVAGGSYPPREMSLTPRDVLAIRSEEARADRIRRVA